MTTPEFTAAVAQILAAADADIASRNPICRNSGKCCQFDTYGHRLYVTTAELLHFAEVHAAPLANASPKKFQLPQFTDPQPGCPYQIEGLCTARDARPLGCRVYFCDKNAQSWQNDLYEKYHAQLQALHERFGIPYRYVEWRHALRELAAEGVTP